MARSITGKIEYGKFEVHYSYHYHPGVHTMPNGDPGYPSEEELEIDVRLNGEEQELSEMSEKEIEIIEQKCLNDARLHA